MSVQAVALPVHVFPGGIWLNPFASPVQPPCWNRPRQPGVSGPAHGTAYTLEAETSPGARCTAWGS